MPHWKEDDISDDNDNDKDTHKDKYKDKDEDNDKDKMLKRPFTCYIFKKQGGQPLCSFRGHPRPPPSLSKKIIQWGRVCPGQPDIFKFTNLCQPPNV